MDWYELPIKSYDPATDSTDLDMYWKIPRKQLLIALACNQFNKMIIEDGYLDDLLKLISVMNGTNITPKDAVFVPFPSCELPEPSEIYCFTSPSGRPDIFIRREYPHRLINDPTDPMELTLFIENLSGVWLPIDHDEESAYNDIIMYMMGPYLEYFSSSAMAHHPCHIGYDPAR